MKTALAFGGLAMIVVAGPALALPEIVPQAIREPVVLAAAVAALVLAVGLVGQRPFSYLLGAVAVAALVAWWRQPGTDSALAHLAGLALGALMFGFVTIWCRTDHRLWAVLTLFNGGSAVLLALGLAGSTIRKDFLPTSLIDWIPQIALGLPGLEVLGRVGPNALGGTALMIAPLGLALGFARRNAADCPTWLRVAGLASGLAATFVLVVTQSRSAWLGAWLAAVIVALRLRAWRPRLWPAGLAVGVPIVIMVTVGLMQPDWRERMLTSAQASSIQRLTIWRQAVEMVHDSPWFGVGLNQFRHRYVRPPTTPDYVDVSHAHNIVLQTALDLGLFGLAAYLALVWRLLVRADRTARGGRTLRACLAAGGGVSLLAVHLFGLADAVALGAKVGVIQWIAAGLILSASAWHEPPLLGGAADGGDHGASVPLRN